MKMHEVSKMERLTLSIPEELKKRLDAMPHINWSEVVKQGISKRLEVLEKLHSRGEL